MASARGEIVVGWQEWVSLPTLGIPAIKAKIDTGAKTSALHTFGVEPIAAGGVRKVRFHIHPLQRRRDLVITCVADVVDRRPVRDSGGHMEDRYVIRTPLLFGEIEREIEITLTNREDMQFRMLVGRSALVGCYLVDPSRSLLLGRALARVYGRKRPRGGRERSR